MLRWLISAVGFAALKGELQAAARRSGRRAALFASALILWLAALGFLVAALTVWLASEVGTIWACFIVAAVLALAGVVIFAGLSIAANRRAQRSPLAAITPGDGPDLGNLGNLGAMATIGVAAFLLGRQIFRRPQR